MPIFAQSAGEWSFPTMPVLSFLNTLSYAFELERMVNPVLSSPSATKSPLFNLVLCRVEKEEGKGPDSKCRHVLFII